MYGWETCYIATVFESKWKLNGLWDRRLETTILGKLCTQYGIKASKQAFPFQSPSFPFLNVVADVFVRKMQGLIFVFKIDYDTNCN